MRLLIIILCFLSFSLQRSFAQTSLNHTVEDQETLFSISRKYNVSVGDIVQANAIQNNMIKIGQVLVIPQKGAEQPAQNQWDQPANEVVKQPASKTYNEAAYYTAKEGETLRGVAYIYQVPVDSLAVWNAYLPDQLLSAGQQIVISVTGEVKQMDQKTKEVQSKSFADLTQEEAKDYDIPMQKVERGNGQVVELPNNTSKLMALHRQETVGSYIKVINPNNDLEAVVRVVAALPDQSIENGVIIKISEEVAKKIGAVNQEFRIRVEYNQ
ncbi:DPBB and LysM peptidoglycan-binding domain-containing protein [Flammeovirga aprica]|uniref:LysM peptidoglycan-binding domain-containing protein n=1 Tax=Flammeovirga aprica JL-4 TaxID=694437 RepID=A0A7X9RQK1_9BACT|nr:LysM peptidoglycan-binding domain-containing protein [Flammeovirga aprica]NME66843.1 LysM peptidoglycan-binding domain-containing protein [Flammeovirga aprica JL-4]